MGRQLLPTTPNGLPKQSLPSETEQGNTKVPQKIRTIHSEPAPHQQKSHQGFVISPTRRKTKRLCASPTTIYIITFSKVSLNSKSHKSMSTVATAVLKSMEKHSKTPHIDTDDHFLWRNASRKWETHFRGQVQHWFFYLFFFNQHVVCSSSSCRKGSCSQCNYSLISGNQVGPSPFDHDIISAVTHLILSEVCSSFSEAFQPYKMCWLSVAVFILGSKSPIWPSFLWLGPRI